MLQNVDAGVKPKTRISQKRRIPEKCYAGNNTNKTEEI